jgi:hypothetical protein
MYRNDGTRPVEDEGCLLEQANLELLTWQLRVRPIPFGSYKQPLLERKQRANDNNHADLGASDEGSVNY